jgi:hypothetical protein
MVKFVIDHNKEIINTDIPVDTTELYFGRFYNKQIKENVLPNSIKKIIFGESFNQEIKINTLPKNLKYITFSRNYKKKITSQIFTHTLTHITFTGSYNYKIVQETLPNSLLSLSFFYNKCEIEPYVLPTSLQYLKLGYNYNYEIKPNVLPDSLIYLELGGIYSNQVFWTKNITTLSITGSKENLILLENLPYTIKKIIFYNLDTEINNLPFTLETIQLMCWTYSSLDFIKKIPFGCKLIDKYSQEIK